MEDFLIRYGLAAVFFGSMVEGDAVPILAGVSAQVGYFGFLAGTVSAIAGLFLSDCVWYCVGRRFGTRIKKTAFYDKHFSKPERFLGNIGVWQILASRAVYGTRTATMLLSGIQEVRFATFAATDLFGCITWATLLGSLGYFLTFSAGTLTSGVKWVEVGVLTIVVVILALIFLKRHLRDRAMKDESE